MKVIIEDRYRTAIPALSSEEKQRLQEDIKQNGVRDAIHLCEDGVLLDGHHRYECDNDCPQFIIPESKKWSCDQRLAYSIRQNLNRRQLSSSQMRDLEKKVLIPLAFRIRWGVEKPKRGAKKPKPTTAEAEVGKLLGIPKTTIQRWVEWPDISTTQSGHTNNSKTGTSKSTPKDHHTSSRTDTKIPEKEHAKIWNHWQRGQTQASIAADYKVNQSRIAQICKSVQKKMDSAAAEEAAVQAAKKEVAELEGVAEGDFRTVAQKIPDKSVQLIFTDPPYDRDSLSLYGDIAQIATRVLCDGGSFICYLGQYQMDKVISLVVPHLRLWWTLAVMHTGKSARMTEYGVVVKWKPMLWFVNGTRRDKRTFVDDLIVSCQEKNTHKWQQSVIEASYYIEKLTKKQDVVFDPFCGGGTTAVAAKQLNRRFITCDVDGKSLAIARKRINDAVLQ